MLHDGAITAALFTADGQLVISMDDRAVRVSELSGELSEVVASSPSGVMRFLALGSVDKRAVVVARSYDRRVLRVIDLDSGQLLVDVREASSGVATAASVSVTTPPGGVGSFTATCAGAVDVADLRCRDRGKGCKYKRERRCFSDLRHGVHDRPEPA